MTATDKTPDNPTTLNWPQRLTDGLGRNGWTQRDAIAELRQLAGDELPDNESMLRMWRRSLTREEWHHAIATSQAGQQHLSDHEPTGVFVQLATQEAEAWARLGDLKEMNRSLGAAHLAVERHPEPPKPEHHFVLDHSKFDWMSMRCLPLAGENRRAARFADRLERGFTNPDGTPTNPIRISEMEGSRALIALRECDLRAALQHANKALDISRRSNPSLLRATDQLAKEFGCYESDNHEVAEFLHDSCVTPSL